MAVPALAASLAVAQPQIVLELGGYRGAPVAPVFALYADRVVIFQAPQESPGLSGYVSTRLTEPQYRALVSRLAPQALLDLHDEYDAITGTDPLANVIHVWVGGRRKTVTVVGHLDASLDSKGRSKAPAAFLRAFDAMVDYSARARPWLPKSIELTLSPRERFPEEVVAWPKEWPSPDSARPRSEGRRQIMLPVEEFNRLKNLLPTIDSSATVQIGGRRWMMFYRLPFPHEEAWARD